MARILSGFNPKRLILPARNIEKANNALEYIKSSNGHADNIEIWEMDLADLQSVKNFANKFIKEVGELHMLFNHAGKNKFNHVCICFACLLIWIYFIGVMVSEKAMTKTKDDF